MPLRSDSNAPRALDARNPTLRALVAALGAVWAAAIAWEVGRHTVLVPVLSPGVHFGWAQITMGVIVLGTIGSALTVVFGLLVLAREEDLIATTQHLQQTLGNLRETNVATLTALADAVEARDPYTRQHAMGAAELATRVARHMGLPEDQVETVRLAAILHDVGKIAVPDRILHKEGPLTPEERKLVQSHPEVGAHLIAGIPFLRDVATVIRHHHERHDGTGYPSRLPGEAIPLGARIVALVDAYSAMTTDRPYRRAMSHADAVTEIQRHAGTQFSPTVAAAFVAEFPIAGPDEGQERWKEQSYPRSRMASTGQSHLPSLES